MAEADEAAPVRRLKPPRTPTALEREEHECSGHVPYRNWRRACVVGAGRMDPHCVAVDDQVNDIPVIGIDNGFLNDRDPAGDPVESAPILVSKGMPDLWISSAMVPRKGTYRWVRHRAARC